MPTVRFKAQIGNARCVKAGIVVTFEQFYGLFLHHFEAQNKLCSATVLFFSSVFGSVQKFVGKVICQQPVLLQASFAGFSV